MATVSNDLLWALTKQQNSFLVKRRNGGGYQFSKDKLNSTGKNTRTSSGFANEKAIGVYKCPNDGQIVLATRSAKNINKPAKAVIVTKFKPHVTGRRAALAVAKAADGYREDQKAAAVTKVSTLARADNKPAKESKKTSRR